MKKNKLVIEINKPVDVVFRFTVDPANTHKWFPFVLEEHTSEPVVKVGTIYTQKVKNENMQISENVVVVTGFVENTQLDFHSVNGTYTCCYRYESIPQGTRLTYSEENGVDGELEAPCTPQVLKKLKELIEAL